MNLDNRQQHLFLAHKYFTTTGSGSEAVSAPKEAVLKEGSIQGVGEIKESAGIGVSSVCSAR